MHRYDKCKTTRPGKADFGRRTRYHKCKTTRMNRKRFSRLVVHFQPFCRKQILPLSHHLPSKNSPRKFFRAREGHSDRRCGRGRFYLSFRCRKDFAVLLLPGGWGSRGPISGGSHLRLRKALSSTLSAHLRSIISGRSRTPKFIFQRGLETRALTMCLISSVR